MIGKIISEIGNIKKISRKNLEYVSMYINYKYSRKVVSSLIDTINKSKGFFDKKNNYYKARQVFISLHKMFDTLNNDMVNNKHDNSDLNYMDYLIVLLNEIVEALRSSGKFNLTWFDKQLTRIQLPLY